MLYAAVLFTIFHGFMWNIPLFWTSYLSETEDGVCYTYAVWPSFASMQAYAVLCGFWLYVLLLVEMVYCYRRIIQKLRKKSATAPVTVNQSTTNKDGTISKHPMKPANHDKENNKDQARRANQDGETSSSQCKPANKEEGISKHQINVIKTMIIISVTFAVTTFMDNYGFIDWAFDNTTSMITALPYFINVTLFYLNVWIDPFIYVLSNSDIRKSFLSHLSHVRGPTTERLWLFLDDQLDRLWWSSGVDSWVKLKVDSIEMNVVSD